MKKFIPFTFLIMSMVSFGLSQDNPRRFSKAWKMAGPEKNWNTVEHEVFYKWRDKIRDRRAKNE